MGRVWAGSRHGLKWEDNGLIGTVAGWMGGSWDDEIDVRIMGDG
jgi:hypothetical protein